MNCKQRVVAAIQGRPVDGIPSCFSYHFREGCGFGEPAVAAHLKFFEETDTDILKIMNENLVPNMGKIRVPDDWKCIRSFSLKDAFMCRQIELVERILEKCDSTRFTMGTLHGAVASAIHPIEAEYGFDGTRRLMCEHLRQNPQPIRDAFRRIADGMTLLAEKYIQLGLDSVFYAALGGEKHYFTDEEFASLVKPLDIQMLDAVKRAGGYAFLHICKKNLELGRYVDYAPYADVVNWGVYEVPCTLAEGRKLFPGKTILGGLENRAGILVEGPIAELKAATRKIIADFGRTGFIMGADCTLPTDLDAQRIRAVVETARSMQ